MEKYRWYRRKRAYYWSELFYPPGNISTRGYSSFGLARPQVGEDFLRSIHPHLSLLDQDLGHPVDFLADGPDCRRHVARMERHVPALNAFGRQRSEGPEVLRQPDRGDHLREFLRRLHPEEPDIRLRGRMDRGGAADQADRHRQFDRPDEISVAVFLPRSEGAVPAGLPRRVRMGPGLDGPPVVPGGHDDRIDPVHDSLVVRRAPERIRIRERVCLQDALDDVLHEHRILLVRDREDLVSVVEDRHPRPVGVRDPDELDLPDHDRTRGARREPAPLPGHPSRVRGCRDDARLLDRHRDQVITLVDPEVHRDPEGDRHRADHVLDHPVDLVELQRPRVPDRLDFRVRELSERLDDLPTIIGALLVETRHLGTLHRGTERRRRLSGHKGIARRLTWRAGSRSSGRMRFPERPASRSWCRSDPSRRQEADPRPARAVPVGLEAAAARTADIHKEPDTRGTSSAESS